jgi:hypothetical protein
MSARIWRLRGRLGRVVARTWRLVLLAQAVRSVWPQGEEQQRGRKKGGGIGTEEVVGGLTELRVVVLGFSGRWFGFDVLVGVTTTGPVDHRLGKLACQETLGHVVESCSGGARLLTKGLLAL